MAIFNCIANPVSPLHFLKLCKKIFVYIISMNTVLIGVILVHIGVDS